MSMADNFCYRCGASLKGMGQVNFCPFCGTRVEGPVPGPYDDGIRGFSSGNMCAVRIEFPAQPVRLSGPFNYFGIMVDGRDMPESGSPGSDVTILVTAGTHTIEIRQVNAALLGSGIVKASCRLDVQGGETIRVGVDGKNLTLSCDGASGFVSGDFRYL